MLSFYRKSKTDLLDPLVAAQGDSVDEEQLVFEPFLVCAEDFGRNWGVRIGVEDSG